VEVTFAGSPDRVEARLVPEAGFELDTFRISGLPRRPGVALARALLLAGAAPRACRQILARRRPDVVLGGGGYVAGPMVFAAWRRRIPAALTEADARLGLANTIAARFARRIFLSYPPQRALRPKERVTGRPLPPRSLPVPRGEARRSLELPEDGIVLGVFGALAGARSLNELALSAWAESGPPVLHLTGQRDFVRLAGRDRRADYLLLPSVERFGAALSAVDLAVSRAGGTVWELAAAGVPAILVPYPHATGNHQTLNARHFESAGGAVLVPESRLEEVPGLVDELLAAPDRLRQMREAMLGLARPGAAAEIAEELVALARRGR
jgi:UDP-N-acetylglucosamine--N-acetylmuramyl-(pentapeptide) pyrophosphoryl-undecaprenol N-acetylglucosamine transferase